MDEHNADMARQIAALAARVEQLEREVSRLTSAASIAPPAPAAVPAPVTPPPYTPPRPAPIAPPPPRSPEPPATPPPFPPRWRPPASARSKPKEPEDGGLDLERLIGGRWYALIGAIIVVIGVALFFKWAYDQGWLRVPPLGRCLGGALFGFAMLAAGEWARRRGHLAAAAGLSGAGVGILYVVVYAAYALYELIGGGPAFVLLAAAAALGIAVAARARLPVLAALAMLGAFAAPVLLYREAGHPLVLPIYLLSLLTLGLVLSGWLGRGFTSLRTLAWWGTAILGGIWAVSQDPPWEPASLIFLALVWAALHAELFVTADKERLAVRSKGSRLRSVGGPVALSFSATAWAVVLGVVVVKDWGVMPDWSVPAAGFAATLTLAQLFAGIVLSLRERPETDTERLGVALATQAGALLIATVAMGIAGWLQAVAWLALGLAAVAAGRWLGTRKLDAYGLVVLCIAAVRILFFQVALPAGSPTAELAGLHLTQGSVLFLCAGVAWWLAARLLLIGDTPVWRPTAVTAAAVGLVLLGLAPVHPETRAFPLAIAWTALCVGAAALRPFEPRLRPDLIGLVGTVAPALVVVLGYPWDVWVDDAGHRPGLYPALWLGLLVAAAQVLLVLWASLAPRTLVARTLGSAGLIAATALVLGVTTLEVARSAALLMPDATAERAAVSLWWGLFAFALLGVGFWKRSAAARRSGLALLAVATLKAVVFDLADVSQGGRVVSFIVLGLLMLAVAVVYGKLSALLIQGRAEPPAEPAGSAPADLL